jgi:hypothetical protein
MAKANLLIAFGTLLIALGGIVATFGWSMRSTIETRSVLEAERAATIQSQRRAMFRTLAAELSLNAEVLTNEVFHETDEAKLAKFVMLPRLQHSALESAIASGLFATQADTSLYSIIVRLLQQTQDFNNRLAEFQTLMTRGDVRQLRTKFRESELLQQQFSLLLTLADALARQGLNLDEQYLKAVNWLTDHGLQPNKALQQTPQTR